VRIAFDKLHRLISNDVALIEEPRSINIASGAWRSEVERGVKQLERGLEGFREAITESVRTLNVLMLGIDPMKYRFLIDNTPHVSWTVSGEYQAVFHRDYNKVPDEVFQNCFDFVLEAALNTSR